MKSPDRTPFHPDTRSAKILIEWFQDIDAKIKCINVVDYPTQDNRPLKVSEIKKAIPSLKNKISRYKGFKIVGLGKIAAKALSMSNIDFFEAPHPSGLNRKLNDQEYVEDMIESLKEYCND